MIVTLGAQRALIVGGRLGVKMEGYLGMSLSESLSDEEFSFLLLEKG